MIESRTILLGRYVLNFYSKIPSRLAMFSDLHFKIKLYEIERFCCLKPGRWNSVLTNSQAFLIIQYNGEN